MAKLSTFVHLNVHTDYSIVDGLLHVSQIAESVSALGMPAIAITESNNLFSAVKFYKESENYGVKPIIGAEINIADPVSISETSRITLLCKDINGYRNLTKLITRAYTEGQRQGIPHVEKGWLDEHHKGLIALSGGKYGEIGQSLSKSLEDKASDQLQTWISLFGDDFYIELHRNGHSGEEEYIHAAIDLAQKYNLPVVATNDVRFLHQVDYEAHEARVCIQQGYTLNDSRRPRLYRPEQYLRSGDEMRELFNDIPEAVENTLVIAEKCNLEFTLGKNYLPHFPVPDGYEQDSWLRHSTHEGLQARLTAGLIPAEQKDIYITRLEEELDVIIKMGFPGYFLIVADFIQWAKNNEIPVGPGRGSGAGSLVAFALGITELNPIEFDLLFERFLNPERISLPDFDIDFCMDRRDEVIEYVAEHYGGDHVSQIITYGTMAAKAVVRDAGRVLGYPYGLVDQIAKLIPFEIGMTLEKALVQEDDLREKYEREEEVTGIIDLALKLEGTIRNAGRHAGGIVIAPRPLTDYMPLYCEQVGSSTVTQFDMGDVEGIGLVKFDFLGLRTLTIIHNAIKDINEFQIENNKEIIDIKSISMDDRETFDLIRRNDTTAIFQLESDGMKKLIKRLQPDSFDDLIALVALFRPGPLQSGMVDDFIERKHGRARVEYAHPAITSILRPTYGVILYQEQVMQIAQVLAGYTLGAADLLRRAMGKKKPEEMAKQREVFTSGATKLGVDQAIATYIFDLMEKFAGYGFNKSHSAAYALIAYQTAWLKSHYPAAFMAAVLSADMDNTDKVVMLLDELESMQIKLETPHVNQSEYRFTVLSSNAISFGLGAIKGVGAAAISNIIEERINNGKYTDLFEFCRRIDLKKANKRVVEALIKSGAMDTLGPNRSSLIASLQGAIQLADQYSKNQASGQDDLFGLDTSANNASTASNPAEFNMIPDWDDDERLAGEKETLGFYLEGHPIIKYEAELRQFINKKLKDIQPPDNVLVAGYIHRIRTRSGSRGRMAEIVLDDRTGRANITVYSDKFMKYRHLLLKDQLVIIRGDVEQDDFFESGYSIIAREIYDLDEIRNSRAKLSLRIFNEKLTESKIDEIKNILTVYRPGNSHVDLHYLTPDSACKVSLGDSWLVNLSENLLAELRKCLGEDNVNVEYNI
ncbi:MAG: DNA polymerase III subunit alpha [Gammaproteobacteria bacterium]|nr:DNA polymerase III subunit alpha [Gammaproteobacteria bacterium]NIN62672.1 DNA polymerase III subunit alpha [Gammaproteobacteria bacterium]NIO63210.1 DNA polymerase III subunit alpha [Gammaproteobacteria bacterium]NIQ11294.1 DNA polymerase III subunit alpha [Gammaproteobacteria bacterium]NIQ20310.1 DNA polymerase III subunit alpha [Gammaproteobacteria bacterium]